MRLLCVMVLGMLGMLGMSGAWAAASGYDRDDVQARALLHDAVEYYRANQERALPVFSRQGPFVRGPYYVYVIDTHGVMLASGGPSASMIGTRVIDGMPADLALSFQQALRIQEEQGIQEAEYRWQNWQSGRVERKKVFFQRVGDKLLAAGYFISKASPESARALLDKAAQAVAATPEATFAAINAQNLAFLEDDLYVFAVDTRTSHYVAHGYNRRLVGTDFRRVRDPNGLPVGIPLLKAAAHGREGALEYQWPNPLSRKVELKHTYYRVVGPYMIAVGYYVKMTE
ncbi:cache domain-containing protein [Pseudomonas nitroreducens]|uniref:Calcium channel protein n=1 Tax=Pseudomonas nitroreducens TaxID=46680 RepID=A0A6G6J318_PSENT|nr:calcium channel protein [Pseudomonas nitroreducens]